MIAPIQNSEADLQDAEAPAMNALPTLPERERNRSDGHQDRPITGTRHGESPAGNDAVP